MFSYTIIYFDQSLVIQIGVQIIFAMLSMMLIMQYRPYESSFANKLEIFNEACVTMLMYIGLCFTENIPDPGARSRIGLSFIISNVGMLLVHFSLLLAASIKAIKRKCKDRCAKKQKSPNSDQSSDKNAVTAKLKDTNISKPAEKY